MAWSMAPRLIRRLEALEAALADLPRQAMRLARWRMRQETSPNPSFKSPHPPRPSARLPPEEATHEVDELLSECQWLAYRADDGRHELKQKSSVYGLI